jgi:hypothetical protein
MKLHIFNLILFICDFYLLILFLLCLGIAFRGDALDEKIARTTIKTNYYGTLHMCQKFIPLMRENAR